MPKVSIVILNWNGLKDTLECLTSLAKITYPNYEVIVVDNGSKGKDALIIKQKFPQVKMIKNKANLGFAEGNNIAIRQILKTKQTDFILLLNNDTTVTKNFLNHLIKTARSRSNSGIIGPKIYYHYHPDGKKIIQSAGASFNLLLGKFFFVNPQNNQPQSVDFVTGACLLIKPSVIKKIGLLDKNFFCTFEDTDWCLKAKKAGYLILYNPQSIIYHKQGQSMVNIAGVYFYTRNLFWLEFRHANLFQLLFFLSYYFLFIFPIYFFGYLIIKKDIKLWKNYLHGLIDGVFAYKAQTNT